MNFWSLSFQILGFGARPADPVTPATEGYEALGG